MVTIKCLFRKHKLKDGVFINGDYMYKWKCNRCGRVFGLPDFSDEYKKNNPPPLPPLNQRRYLKNEAYKIKLR